MLNIYDRKRLEYVEKCFQNTKIFNFSDSDMQELQDLLILLCTRKVLQDLEVDNANAFLKIGDFKIFEKWLEEVTGEMKTSDALTTYAEQILREIIEHKDEKGNYDSDYWKQRFEGLTRNEDALVRSCFKELREADFVNVTWADNHPYYITVTSKGLFYYDNLIASDQQREEYVDPFSAEELISTANDILRTEYQKPVPGLIVPDYVSGEKYNKWINDLRVFHSTLPSDCPLKDELGQKHYYKDSSVSTVKHIIGLLESIKEWTAIRKREKIMKESKTYDVFLSHASQDKSDYVDALYMTLRKLGIRIFYDSDILSWGDKWKQVILNSTNNSEFAIIVISENFFGREWTEKELTEFLNRQNDDGQKLVLPLLYNVTIDRLKEVYPQLGDIQVLETKDHSKEEIAILFAKELIKRIRE